MPCEQVTLWFKCPYTKLLSMLQENRRKRQVNKVEDFICCFWITKLGQLHDLKMSKSLVINSALERFFGNIKKKKKTSRKNDVISRKN